MIPRFRAWLKHEQEMHNVLAFDTRGHSFLGIEGTHVTVDAWCDYFEVGTQVEVMQSTGLKDKNGVEIFEGDIVQSFSNINRISDPHLTETIEPKYDNRIVIYTNGAFVLSDDGKREYSGVLNHYVGAMVKDLEIVGNIYEHPELLEEQR